ncbi:MAG: hypothetical protein JOZ56_03855 [Actinobacteria bacterium]|nr:hypothetical protein [Actinomycetota bacterium]
MRVRVILAAGIAAAVAAGAAGLAGAFSGGPSPATAAGGLGAGAAVAPANAAAFVALDSNLDSSQWQAVDSLLTKAGVLSQLQQGLQKQTGLSWDELKAALGPEVDVVVLPGGSAQQPQAVVLTQPSDSAKFDALLQKSGTKTVTAQVDGWTAVSNSQASLDAVTGATQHLAADSLYQEANAKLTGDSFAQVYANGAEAGQLASSFGAKTTTPARVVWVAGDVVATSGGLRMDGFVKGDGSGQATQPYTAALVDRIPSGALLVADFQAKQRDAAASSTNPIVASLGKLANALGGESAVYVTPDLPFPAVTLVTQTNDPQAVLDALDQTLSSAGSAAGGSGSGTGGFSLGSILGGLKLSHEVVGNDLVVSTSQSAINAFKGGGSKLSGDSVFTDAQSAAGMPGQTTGFVYVNLHDALPYVKSMLGGAIKSTQNIDLSSLQSALVFGTGASGDVSKFSAFLTVH